MRGHIVILVAGFVISLTFMLYGEQLFGGDIQKTLPLTRSYLGLGVIIPVLARPIFLYIWECIRICRTASSRFHGDLPIVIGAVLTVLLLSKLIDYIIDKHTQDSFTLLWEWF